MDVNVIRGIERSTEIEVTEVKDDEFGAPAREDAVDHELDEFEWGRFGADVAGITDAVASNGDTSTIRIGFFGADFADYLGVCDSFAAVGGDGIVVNDERGVGTADVFAGVIRVSADALAETAQFICARFVPNLVKIWVLENLAVL